MVMKYNYSRKRTIDLILLHVVILIITLQFEDGNVAKIKTFFIYLLGAIVSLLTLNFLKTAKDKGVVKKELKETSEASEELDSTIEELEEAKIDPEGVQPTEDDSEEYWSRVLKDD